MKREELLEEWTEGESGVRPRRVQALREELIKHTGLTPPRRRSEIESWIERMKGHITRKLKSDDEGE